MRSWTCRSRSAPYAPPGEVPTSRRSTTTASCSRRTSPGMSPTTRCCTARTRRATAMPARMPCQPPANTPRTRTSSRSTRIRSTTTRSATRAVGQTRVFGVGVLHRLAGSAAEYRNVELGFLCSDQRRVGTHARVIEFELSGSVGRASHLQLGYTFADGELTEDVYQPAGNFYGGPLFDDQRRRRRRPAAGQRRKRVQRLARVRHGLRQWHCH